MQKHNDLSHAKLLLGKLRLNIPNMGRNGTHEAVLTYSHSMGSMFLSELPVTVEGLKVTSAQTAFALSATPCLLLSFFHSHFLSSAKGYWVGVDFLTYFYLHSL